MMRLADRTISVVFYAFCLAGVAVSLGLAVKEGAEKPPIAFGEERVVVRGPPASVVEVAVTNQSSVLRCPEVRIAARDREGRDLAEARARSLRGGAQIAPSEVVTYSTVLEGITEQEYREDLKEFSAYVFATRDCP